MMVIGVDPGTIRCGYGVIRRDGNRLTRIDSGTIKLNQKSPLVERLLLLHDALRRVIGENGPDEGAVEDLFFAQNANSALKLGHARGVVLLALGEAGLPIVSYPPTTVKRAITGQGRAPKNQVGQVVKAILGIRTPLGEDEADALAIAICHSNHSINPVGISK